MNPKKFFMKKNFILIICFIAITNFQPALSRRDKAGITEQFLKDSYNNLSTKKDCQLLNESLYILKARKVILGMYSDFPKVETDKTDSAISGTLKSINSLNCTPETNTSENPWATSVKLRGTGGGVKAHVPLSALLYKVLTSDQLETLKKSVDEEQRSELNDVEKKYPEALSTLEKNYGIKQSGYIKEEKLIDVINKDNTIDKKTKEDILNKVNSRKTGNSQIQYK
ncbi:MAG: hypothetical protein JWQ09_1257 [Segetibacter sp.]|nr:hypothetical protein [Segetibacter sp.]